MTTTELDPGRCKVRAKTTGKQCGNRPMQGQAICRMHGGAARQNREKAKERLAAQAIKESAEAELAHYGVTAVEDPLLELSKLASASTALMHALGARVNALDELENSGTTFAPAIKAEVAMYERAMDRTGRLLDSLVKHGYMERQVSLAEREALLVSGIIRRVLAGLGLSTEQLQQAQTLLAAEFRALEGKEAK